MSFDLRLIKALFLYVVTKSFKSYSSRILGFQLNTLFTGFFMVIYLPFAKLNGQILYRFIDLCKYLNFISFDSGNGYKFN